MNQPPLQSRIMRQRPCRTYAPINVKPAGGGGGGGEVRQGIVPGFDRYSWPVGRPFDLSCCPRGTVI